MSEDIRIESKNKINKKLLTGTAVFIAVALVAVLVVFAPKTADAKKIREQLSLGEKYLSELKYEQAEAAYLAVIEIDPKNVDAYLGLADVYVAQGEYDKAISVLEDALSNFNGNAAVIIEEKLKEVHTEKERPEATQTSVLTAIVAPIAISTPVPTNMPTLEPKAKNIFKWEVKEDGTVVILELLNKNLTYVEVPTEIEGKTVTELGEFSFKNCKYLKEVILPKGITSIGRGAFFQCHELQEMILPTGITEIKNETFRGCSSLTNVVLPDGITKIGEQAFTSCKSIESIALPDSVVEIGNSAFTYCQLLKEISLPNRLEKIGKEAFYHCENLKNIVLPNSLTTVEDSAFGHCSALEEIIFSENIKHFGEGVFFLSKWLSLNREAEKLVIVNGILYRGINKESVVIPEGVTRIAECAFQGCYNVKSVSFPDSLKTIDVHAFIGTEWGMQRDLVIAGKVLYDRGYSTDGDVIVPEGIISISDFAFAFDLERITSVYIPTSVKEIGKKAFEDSPHIIIITPSGSYAEQYAKEYGIPYKTQ